MKRLNRKGYLTIEIILGATIAFAIAFFLIEITSKMVSDTEDTFKDTVVTTDSALIISGVKDVVENNKDGISNIVCSSSICTINYIGGNTGTLKIEENKLNYYMNKPGDSSN